MKRLFIFLLISFAFQAAISQDTNVVVINPAKQNEHDLLKKKFQYPQFVPGRAFYKNENITDSKFNYNYLTSSISFLTPKGDTLDLVQGEDFSKITIGTDTFCYYKKQFIQQVSHYATYNLFLKRSIEFNGYEKKGAYDSYSGTSATTSYKNYSTGTGGNVNLTPDENLFYAFKDYYFFSGKFGQFYPATKKGVYELFSKNEKQLKDFLEENKTNFNKKEDLEKLLTFAQSVLK